MKKNMIVLIAVIFLFTGCSTMQNAMQYLSKEPIMVEYGVKKAVRLCLDERPLWADAMYRISSNVITFIENKEVTIPELENYVRQQIEWNELYSEDQKIIDSLIAFIKAELTTMIKDNELPTDVQIGIKNMFIWIRDISGEFVIDWAKVITKFNMIDEKITDTNWVWMPMSISND
jgi:uncharacterized lipoprotein YajG